VTLVQREGVKDPERTRPGYCCFRYSFICQGTLTRSQRSNLFGLRVKLPPVTTSLTTQR